jgi:hypothetical protein
VAACGDGGEAGRVPREAGFSEVEIFVRLGVQVPTIGDLPRSIGVVCMGRLAEDAGADSLWVNDHVLMVEGALDGERSSYPFSEDGVPWWSADMPWYECLTAASFLAATTRGCEVGTSVLVLPQRNVLELAKTRSAGDDWSSALGSDGSRKRSRRSATASRLAAGAPTRCWRRFVDVGRGGHRLSKATRCASPRAWSSSRAPPGRVVRRS